MAKIEEVKSAAHGMERWQAEAVAAKLDKDIKELKVAMAELDTVRPKRLCFAVIRTTCVKRANVFFVEKRDVIVKTKRNELKDKEKGRHDVGLHLRSLTTHE